MTVGNLYSPGVVLEGRRLREKGGLVVTLEDAKLAEQAKGGDGAAYEQLVRLHEAVAFRAAYVIRSAVVFGWWLAPMLIAGFVWWRRRNRGPRPATDPEP